MRARSPLTIAACLACAAALPAAAQDAPDETAPPVTPEGARALAVELKRMFDPWGMADRAIGAEVHAELQVRAAGERYVATAKDIRYEIVGVGVFDLGSATSHLVPQPGGTFYVESRMAERLEFRPVIGGPFVLTIGEQSMRGVLDPSLQTFLNFDLRLGGIGLAFTPESARMDAGALLAWGDTRERPDGRLDYGGVFELRDVRMIGANGESHLARVWVDTRIEALALAEYIEFYRSYIEILAPLGGTVGGEIGIDEMRRLADLFERTDLLLDGYDYAVGVSGLSIDRPNGETFLLDEAVLTLSGGSFEDRTSSLHYGLSIGPMTATPLNRALPTEVTAEIALLDIPNAAVVDGMIAAMRASAAADDRAAEMAGRAFLDAVVEAGTRLALETLSVRLPESWLEAGGELRSDSASPYGATGSAWIDMGGLNDYLAALSEQDREGHTPLIGLLTVLQGISQPQAAEATEPPLRRLEVELDESGRLLVNGADLAPLLDTLD